MLRSLIILLGLSLFTGVIVAGDQTQSSYRLFPRDLITFEVYGEANLPTKLRISGTGEINVPLLGAVKIAGMDLATAEKTIAECYRKANIFIRPQVNLQIAEYSKKEVSVLGQVVKQSTIPFPEETTSMSIVEAIAAAGGFTRISRSDAVRVTRHSDDGPEQTFTVNVESMLQGNKSANTEAFRVLPDDVIFVPERLF